MQSTSFSIPRADTIGKGKTVLFLQGHPSRFWRDLATAFEAEGHTVLKVHFCLADVAFWGARSAHCYWGNFAGWPDWLRQLIRTNGITDIIYYADRQPYHAAARDVANRLGIRAWAMEFGYLRPDWLTFERDGMGPISHFPKEDADLEALAAKHQRPDLTPRFQHSFTTEAINEVSFGLLRMIGRPLFPFHRSDLYYAPVLDYLSWLREFANGPSQKRNADAIETRIRQTQMDYTLVAMQLQADYQIRCCSPYPDLQDFLCEVIGSFANHADPKRHLIFKLHPLDNGMERWGERVARLADSHGVSDRVHVIKGGDLGFLLKKSKGVVLVNSTVGLHALRLGVPICAMGHAIYDRAGLTHQSGLDQFWAAPEAGNPERLEVFLRALSAIQIKGSFFHPEGRKKAIAEISKRLRDIPEIHVPKPQRAPYPSRGAIIGPAQPQRSFAGE